MSAREIFQDFSKTNKLHDGSLPGQPTTSPLIRDTSRNHSPSRFEFPTYNNKTGTRMYYFIDHSNANHSPHTIATVPGAMPTSKDTIDIESLLKTIEGHHHGSARRHPSHVTVVKNVFSWTCIFLH